VRLFAVASLTALSAVACASEGTTIERVATRERRQIHVDPRGLVREGAPMLDARGDHFAMRLEGDRVLVMGGGPKSIEIYDTTRDQWSHWDDLPPGVSWVAAAQIDDDDAWVLLSSFEPLRYQVSKKTFVPIAPLPFTACATTFARLPSGKILAVGGQDCGRPGETLPDVAVYDPARDAWSAHPPLRHARSFASVASVATPLGDAIVVRGGGELAERWDPRTESWSDVLDDPAPPKDLRPGSVTTALGDGRTLITGGLEGCGRTCLHPLARTILQLGG
jgi:hypothetical protein